MKQKSTEEVPSSKVIWESLEDWVRFKIRGFLQDLLEEEVVELLGRPKSKRRKEVDASPGYRNGYGKPRKLTLGCGTVTIRRPRVRCLEERFESRILPLFERRTKQVGDLLPELYLHGLAEGDFDLALRGLLGEGAPLSAGSIARLKEKWEAEYEEWKSRSLSDLKAVYLWVDGVYVKAGLEKEKAAVLVALAGLSDGRKVFVSVESGYRESTESWSAVLRALRSGGLRCPRLVIGDGHLGIWGALRNVFPEAEEQRCWNHRIGNVLDRIGKKKRTQAGRLLKPIPYAPTLGEAERLKGKFQEWCQRNGVEKAGTLLEVDWDRMVTFYRFPKEHWKHLRTTNPVESPFSTVRIRTNAARRYKKVERATAVIWKTLMIAEKRFRRLDAPDLLMEVSQGAKFVDGVCVKKEDWKDAA